MAYGFDPSIAAGVLPPVQQNPFAALEMAQRLQDQRAQEQERQMHVAQMQQAQADQAALRQVLQSSVDADGNIDINSAVAKLTASGRGDIAEKLRADHAKMVDGEITSRKNLADALDKELTNLQRSASSVRDQGSLNAFIVDVARSKGPGYANAIPKDYTPQNQQQLMTWFDDAKDQVARQKTSIEAAAEARAENDPELTKKAIGSLAFLPPDRFAAGMSDLKQAILSKHPDQKYLFDAVQSPQDAANLALTPEQRAQQASTAASQVTTAARDAWTKTYQQRELDLRQKEMDLRQGDEKTSKNYQAVKNSLDKLRGGYTDNAARMERLEATLAAATPQSDALVAPELLTVMAGGQGSGLRMNEAEISRIVGGRNKWQDLQSRINAWQTDPSKPFLITTEQRQQIKSLIAEVQKRVRARLTTVQDADEALLKAGSVEEQRRILIDTQKALETPFGGASAGAGKDPLGIR